MTKSRITLGWVDFIENRLKEWKKTHPFRIDHEVVDDFIKPILEHGIAEEKRIYKEFRRKK